MTIGRKTGGRRKGTPNKHTASVKQALEQTFIDMGGVESLTRWGKDNPTEFYKLWAKMLPQEFRQEINGRNGEPMEAETARVIIVPQKVKANVVTRLLDSETE
ncbi:hypothetical protein JQR88_06130 [Pseudomonas luteola]|uniref:hypothetical protein n=1 Tax=Pseudomonas luteola TaxID=47886 RepID=UPI003DA157D7